MAGTITPMMRQYLELKDQYKDCFLFYRLGDFYEMFFDDAKTVSKLLGLTLTGRDCGLDDRAPMCGVPYHSVDGYINRLIALGCKVAICDQMEDPATAKGLVERAITRIITPGTVIDNGVLDSSKNNYIVCVYLAKNGIGCACCDVSTGAFSIAEYQGESAASSLIDELARLDPGEVLANETLFENELLTHKIKSLYYLEKQPEVAFRQSSAVGRLCRHFGVNSLDGFGITDKAIAVCAAGALMKYLEDTQKNALSHIRSVRYVNSRDHMHIDASTRRNLELVSPLNPDGSGKNTLFGLLNLCKTGMGSRTLRTWIESPLQNKLGITQRLDAVDELFNEYQACQKFSALLDRVYDIERLSSKIAYGTIGGKDCVALLRSLQCIAPIKAMLGDAQSDALVRIQRELDCMDDAIQLLDSAISPDAPVAVKDGGFIRSGYNAEVDELREIERNSKAWLEALVTREREANGIKTLRIGYNRVFGYYIEVSKSFTGKVPYNYERKQTLVNAERYITPELKEIEQKVLTAGDRLLSLETELYAQVKEALLDCIERLQADSTLIGELDAYCALAITAKVNRYVKPAINEEGIISIYGGRHPIVEHSSSESFIPNDVLLNRDADRLLIITGPNMAGKSTFMRQTALITLMAHIGSFVPADSADVCIVDRIFTRIGASDDLASGRSTFMVEMNEMANILNNATRDSLLILDEIGRGTSTFDGLSIAWAVLEHVADIDRCGAKTLFATHFHELSELEGKLDGVKNFRISVKEMGESILFLRKIVRGSADKSFGIQVARLAGIPDSVLKRAKEILGDLEQADLAAKEKRGGQVTQEEQPKAGVITGDADRVVIQAIKALDINAMSPMEALKTLFEYSEILMG